jgi:hypothetical protein
MKRFVISVLLGFCLVASAKDKAIEEFTLDEQTVYPIRVAADRVTTISFPGPISAIDAAQASADPRKIAPFLIAYTKGSTFFSVRALAKKVKTNVNVRWNKKTYVLELSEGDDPFLSVIFRYQPEETAGIQSVEVTPSRLLALLDKAKAYPLLLKYHPDSVADVQYRNYEKQPRIVDCPNYSIRIDEVFRFDAEDTLVFRVSLKNKTGIPLQYAPNGFSLRVGERTYPQSVSDAGGFIPPQAEIPAYFAVTGTPNGGRNDISVKNDFYVILEAQPAEAKGGAQ